MSMNPVERLVQRRQVHGLVEGHPVELDLLRRPKSTTANGGWTYGNPVSVIPGETQRFRLTPFKRRIGPGETQSPDGPIADNQFLLIADTTSAGAANVLKGDTFLYEGDWYEVERVHPRTEIRTVAVVDWKGDAP